MNASYKDVRIWQTHFSVHSSLKNLPIPEMVVEEEQSKPDYRCDGKFRSEDGSQIVITLAGRGSITVAGKTHSLTCGRAFLHNHDDSDVCYYYPADGKEPWRFLWLAFYGANSKELVMEINRKQGYLFDVPEDSELIGQLREYRKHAGVIQIMSPFEGAELVYSTLEKLCSSGKENEQPDLRSSLTREVQNIIAADPAAELQVEKLASNFNVSREHLSRIFCSETGISLHEYIIRFRLKLAIDLLRRTRLSLKEISFRCGWNDYSNFYRIFIKRFNCSPQDIRNSRVNK